MADYVAHVDCVRIQAEQPNIAHRLNETPLFFVSLFNSHLNDNDKNSTLNSLTNHPTNHIPPPRYEDFH